MAETTTPIKRPCMVRLAQPEDAAVRAIALREGESQATVLRRLIRRGLLTERRDSGEAA